MVFVRCAIVLLACLVWVGPAAAAQRWADRVPFTDSLPGNGVGPALGVTGDGTRVVAWQGADNALLARIGDRPAVTLGPGQYPGVVVDVATGAAGQAAIAWTDDDHVAVAMVDGGTIAPAVTAVSGGLQAVRMNADGDVAVLGETGTPEGPYGTQVLQLAFRPAGGQFGAAVSPGAFQFPEGEYSGFALGPTGESLLLLHDGGIVMPGALDLYSRERDGPLSAPYRVSDSALYGPVLAADGGGRVVVLHSSPAPMASIRALDGAWKTVPAAFPFGYPGPSLGLSANGDLVLAQQGPGFEGHNVAPPLPPSPPSLVTGSLDAGTFSAPVQLPGGRGAGFAMATARDGSTVIAYLDKDANTTWVVRRSGAGPFFPPQAAACGQTGPSGAGIADDGTATLLIGNTTVTETKGTDIRTCPPRELAGRVEYTPAHPVAGRPVTITVHRLHGTGAYPLSATFRHGHDVEPVKLAGTRGTVTYTFPRAGRRIHWSIRVKLKATDTGARTSMGRHVTVRVRRGPVA
jgi:hypothetical protein